MSRVFLVQWLEGVRAGLSRLQLSRLQGMDIHPQTLGLSWTS